IDHLGRKVIVEFNEEFFVGDDLLSPGRAVHLHQFFKILAREVEPGPVDVLIPRNPADGSLAAAPMAMNAFDDPSQYSHVFAESRPEELAILIFAEPVHLKNPRSGIKAALHLDPVPEVVAHVVAAEGEHGHRITPDLSNGTCCGSGRL